MGLKKKCVIITIDNLPVMICEVKELEPLEFIAKQRECEQNRSYLKNLQKNRRSEVNDRIAELEKQIKILKGED